MNGSKKIVVGYAPTRRNVFNAEEAIKYKNIILDKIKKYGHIIVDINDIKRLFQSAKVQSLSLAYCIIYIAYRFE